MGGKGLQRRIHLPLIYHNSKVRDQEEVTEEAVTTTLRRSLSLYSAIQAYDGRWARDYEGPMFLLPGLVKEKSSNHHVI
ncbi:hypothetical protein ACFX2I_022821 [Malus domestica]